uniref:Reverse transcriptase domain-containing protein n=1 Tax=Nicotiana tabacum TaxID=4097 RepID=A0A1S4AXD4_TOBAC|nr:PREDICTED: uncharacterized protein LOC107802323 [Nicotiana tabacum]
MVKQWWQGYVINGSPDFILSQKLKFLKRDLVIWNREVFGKISTRTNKALEELLILEQATEGRVQTQAEKSKILQLKMEIQQLAKSEEISWRLQVGEDIIEDKAQVKEVILDFYQELYSKNENQRPGAKFEGLGSLNAEEKERVLNIFLRKRKCGMLYQFLCPGQELWTRWKGAIELKDFRPISLIGSVYKIVAKVLTARLKKIGDKKSGEPGLLFTLDIEKAFEKLNWQYLISILWQMRFGEKWIEWIRYSFTTVKYSVLVNRSPVGFFSPKRGIRQGDPISPFLFILAMEGLSRMLKKAKQMQWLQGFDVGRNSGLTVSVSHLLFADDTLIFCGADKSQVQFLNLTLMLFEAVSGLHINMSKSIIYLVNVVPELEELADIIYCNIGSFPTSYLGLPLGASRRSTEIWNAVIEKFEKRRSFLWEGNSSSYKFHLVKWAKVTLPKTLGGLGVKDLALHNKSMLMKWHWRYNQEDAGLWKEIVQAKYGATSHWCTNAIRTPYGSGLWKGIRRLWDDFSCNTSLQVGNGALIQFWKDKWLGHTTQKEAFPRLFLVATNPDSTIAQNMEDNTWRLNRRRDLNDWEIEDPFAFLESLQNSSFNTQSRDKLKWGNSREVTYSVRASYL